MCTIGGNANQGEDKITADLRIINPFNRAPSSEFKEILFSLSGLGVTYMSYTLAGKDCRVHFHSDQTWAKIFLDEGLIKFCPLDEVCRKPISSIVRWSQLSGLTQRQKGVMDCRSDLNIRNGITITNRIYNLNEMVAFATEFQNINIDKVVLERMAIFKEAIEDIRNIAFYKFIQEQFLFSFNQSPPPGYWCH